MERPKKIEIKGISGKKPHGGSNRTNHMLRVENKSVLQKQCSMILREFRNGKTDVEIKEKLEMSTDVYENRIARIIKTYGVVPRTLVWIKFEAKVDKLVGEAREIAEAALSKEEIVLQEDGQIVKIRQLADPVTALRALKLQLQLAESTIKVAQTLGVTHKEPERQEVLEKHLHIIAAVENVGTKDDQAGANIKAFESVVSAPRLKADVRIEEGEVV